MDIAKIGGALKRQRTILIGVMLLGIVVFVWAVTLGRTYQAVASVVAFAATSPYGGLTSGAKSDPLADPSSAMIAPQDVPALIKSSPLLAAVARDAHLGPRARRSLKKRVSAKTAIGSEVIALEVTDSVPERAVATANALARELRAYESHLATSRYDALIADVGAQVKRRADGLRKIDRRISAITAADPFLSAETGTSSINQQIVSLSQQYSQALAAEQSDLSALAVASLRPGLARQLAGHEIIMEDPEFKERLTQYGKDVAQRDLTAAGYTAAYPGLAGINEQVARENASLQQAERKAIADPAQSKSYVQAQLDANKADAAFVSDRAQVAALGAELSEAQAHLTGSGGSAVQLAALRRDRDAANAAFVAVSQRLASTIADRSQAAAIGTVVIVDPAVEAAPTLLSQPLVLAVALGVAFAWLAITLAFFADGFDTRLHDEGAVERLYGRPVLTTI